MQTLQTTNNTLREAEHGQLSEKVLYESFNRFLAYIDVKPTSILAYTKNLKAFAAWLQENNIIAPTREDIIAFKDSLKATHKATTIQSYLNTVKQFFKWLNYEGLYMNVAENVKGVRISKGFKKDYLRLEQIQKVLKQFKRDTQKSKRDFAIISLCACCGLRTIELERANIGDMQNLGAEAVLYILGKGRDDKSDFVKLPFEAEEAIRDYLNTREDKNNPDAPLFESVSNNSVAHRLDKGSISRAIKTAFRNVGLDSDKLTAHSLRHTAATLNLLNGGTLEETQQLLRHSSINTTMIYNHALERANNQSENRIASAIFSERK